MKISALKETVIGAMENDASLQTLVGGDGGDNRLYWFFSAQAAKSIDQLHRAYIVYQLLAANEITDATARAYMRFTTWGTDQQIVEDIRDRLVALFERRQYALSDGSVVYGKLVQETDAFDEGSNFAGRIVEIRFGCLNVAPSWIQVGWTQ